MTRQEWAEKCSVSSKQIIFIQNPEVPNQIEHANVHTHILLAFDLALLVGCELKNSK